MLNYRTVSGLLLLCVIVLPLSFQWATASDGQWWRPFAIWALFIYGVYLQQRHRADDHGE
ncbi:MAG: hypothetical protein ACN4EJ_01660 [Porticoccaceae bacterium]